MYMHASLRDRRPNPRPIQKREKFTMFQSKCIFVKKSRRGVSLVLVLSLLAGPGIALAADLPPPQDGVTLLEPNDYPPFLIGPGDVLSVFVYGEGAMNMNAGALAGGGMQGGVPAQQSTASGFPTTYMVDSNGVIVLPLAGAVDVAGLSQTQAGAAVEEHLLPFEKDPQVTVLIQDSATYAVSIMGEVNKPGKYQVRGKPGLLDMLAIAGGPTESAALNRAVLIRGKRRTRVDLRPYMVDTRFTGTEPLLYPGDTVFVPMTRWPVGIGGWSAIVGVLVGVIATAAIVSEAEYQRTH